MPGTWLDQVPSTSGSEAEPNHLAESLDASQHNGHADDLRQELTPASTAGGLAGLENTPGVASAVSAAGSSPPAATKFMLRRVLNKKAKELKLALEVKRVVGQRFETVTSVASPS